MTMINPLSYPVPSQYSYSYNNNNNNSNNSSNNSNNNNNNNNSNNNCGVPTYGSNLNQQSMAQDLRVPEQYSISSPSPKKRPFNSTMTTSPPTPTLLSNSPYIHGSHIVPQYSPQLQNVYNTPNQSSHSIHQPPQQTPNIFNNNNNNNNNEKSNNQNFGNTLFNSITNNSSNSSNSLIQQNNLTNNGSSSSSSSSSTNFNQNNNFINSSNDSIYNSNICSFYGNTSSSSSSSLNGIESPPSVELMDDDIEDQLREYISPVIWGMMDNYAREQFYNAIVEFINEEISFRSLLLELRVIAVMDVNYKSIFQFLVDLFLSIEPNQKMVNYLRDNGVEENEFNIDLKSLELSSDNDSNQKKKRERIRKSVSRGLRNPPNKWAKEESQKLIQLVHEHGDKQWKKIAHQIGGGKTGAQCAQHWKRVLCPAIRKGSWDEDEESKLFNLVEKHGQSWKNVASEIRTRTDIQCRYQYFKSCMSREVQWSSREDEILQKKVSENNQQDGTININNTRDISWMDVSKAMARGRQTKIPRTALECKTRYFQLNFGGAPIQIVVPHNDDHLNNNPHSPLNSLLQDQNCY
ncbi:hypothetical protein ACTFIR_000403 [Dictyostelium discoideum]